MNLLSPVLADQIEFDIETIQTKTYVSVSIKGGLSSTHSYKIMIQAQGDLHANILFSSNSGIQVIPDGLTQRIFMHSDKPVETRYFTYLPPSPKFSFTLNTRAFTFGVPYTIMIKKMSG